MGKRIIAQRRGRGSLQYRVHSFHHKGEAKLSRNKANALVTDLIHCSGHSAPLAEVRYDDGEKGLIIASEGLAVGDTIDMSSGAKVDHGNVMKLSDVPEGVSVFNIEAVPGDGGKFVRSSGAVAKVVSKSKSGVLVRFPSRRQKEFNHECRVMIGGVAGAGRVEKPFLKAGSKHKAMKVKHKYWPNVSPNSMNAVDHPFGNSRSTFKSKSRPAPTNAPPGRRVGAIRPRKTGRSRSRRV